MRPATVAILFDIGMPSYAFRAIDPITIPRGYSLAMVRGFVDPFPARRPFPEPPMPATVRQSRNTLLPVGLLAILLAACGGAPRVSAEEQEAAAAGYARAQALFEEKCRTVAGERIYRKVENVEGLLLMKLRPERGDRELKDRYWPGAAFARETSTKEYITTFLGYEYASNPMGRDDPVTPTNRGYINTDRRPGGIPGYRYVDVIDENDGMRYRYRLVYKPRPTSQIGYVDAILEKNPAPDPAPRYGVSFEDHVIAEERELGLASSTVKVIDLQTGEVLGEMLRYAWSRTGPSRTNPAPWLTAWRCPDHAVGTSEATRKFADQVLIPLREK